MNSILKSRHKLLIVFFVFSIFMASGCAHVAREQVPTSQKAIHALPEEVLPAFEDAVTVLVKKIVPFLHYNTSMDTNCMVIVPESITGSEYKKSMLAADRIEYQLVNNNIGIIRKVDYHNIKGRYCPRKKDQANVDIQIEVSVDTTCDSLEKNCGLIKLALFDVRAARTKKYNDKIRFNSEARFEKMAARIPARTKIIGSKANPYSNLDEAKINIAQKLLCGAKRWIPEENMNFTVGITERT